MFKTLRNAFKIPDLRKKIIYVLVMVTIIRLGYAIAIPGVDVSAIRGTLDSITDMGFIGIMTGGSLEQMSIFALNIFPYITASIIMNLLTIAIPRLEEIQKEGEEGKKKITKYTRYLTIILALMQAIAYSIAFKGMYISGPLWLNVAFTTIVMTAGTAFLMWIGERITEHGVGNGISIIIAINIISSIPTDLYQLYAAFVKDKDFMIALVAVIIIATILLAIIAFVVLLQEGERRIPVQYAKKMSGRKMVGGQSTYIPLKVNTAGVIPVIFASSLLGIPSIIDQFFSIDSSIWRTITKYISIQTPISQNYGSAVIIYALLIIFFAYFYTSITFNPMEVGNNMKKNGGFIPGIRPGKPTVEYLTNVVNSIVFVGAIGLTLVSIIPIIIVSLTSINISFLGTSIIIVVGVALETIKQIESQMLMRHYKGFLNA